MTDARDAYLGAMVIGGCIFAVVCVVGLVMLIVAIADELKRKPLRVRRAERLEAAGADAVLQLDLDAWEAELKQQHEEFMARFTPELEVVAAVPTPTPAALQQPWPTRQTPLLQEQAEGYVRDAPLVLWRPDPHWATIAPNYGRDTSEWRWERDSGAPVVDEQSHAAEVLQGLSRPRTQNTAALAMSQAFGHVVDAMPVSPAPQGRTRRAKGHNPGTDAQRLDPAFVSWEQADWEQPTGAFPMLTMAGAR